MTRTPNGKRLPNPGSDEAIELGCRCPVLDNAHGKFAPWPPDGWWTSPRCPIHGDPAVISVDADAASPKVD